MKHLKKISINALCIQLFLLPFLCMALIPHMFIYALCLLLICLFVVMWVQNTLLFAFVLPIPVGDKKFETSHDYGINETYLIKHKGNEVLLSFGAGNASPQRTYSLFIFQAIIASALFRYIRGRLS